MSTLWSKGTQATDLVEDFTVGNDRILDMRLAKYDVIGSKAHIRMLESIGLLTAEELETLTDALDQILGEINAGEFVLEDDVEDIHSQVELLLTRRLGDIGKKIHSGRSRNDQVLVDVKLFLKDEVITLRDEVLALFYTLQTLSEKHKDTLMPGYTHGQVAMPSSFGLWFGAYAEALADDMYMLKGAFHVTDQNPLGSAAGYGSSFPLDRQMTTELLDFGSLDYNVVAAQLSRGKSERAVASAMGAIALTLNKFAADCCMYMSPNYGFIKFPDELTTGSSIMPHKKNPDVFELTRAKCNKIQALPQQIMLIMNNLPSGYFRDMQLTKEIYVPAFKEIADVLRMAEAGISQMWINRDILADEKYKYLFTVEDVNDAVAQGVPFRDAYREVGMRVQNGTYEHDGRELNHTHEGSIGNLCLDRVVAKFERHKFDYATALEAESRLME